MLSTSRIRLFCRNSRKKSLNAEFVSFSLKTLFFRKNYRFYCAATKIVSSLSFLCSFRSIASRICSETSQKSCEVARKLSFSTGFLCETLRIASQSPASPQFVKKLLRESMAIERFRKFVPFSKLFDNFCDNVRTPRSVRNALFQ